MSPMHTEYNIILSQVRRWPVEKRIALLKDVLGTLAFTEKQEATRPKDTLSKALGLLRSNDGAPDDEIDAMLAQRRFEKYG